MSIPLSLLVCSRFLPPLVVIFHLHKGTSNVPRIGGSRETPAYFFFKVFHKLLSACTPRLTCLHCLRGGFSQAKIMQRADTAK